MSKKSNSELEKLDSWDVEHAQVMPPVSPSRLVVSVSFPREDFVQISKHAKLVGKKISQYIRDAAIEKTYPQREIFLLSYFGGSGGASWSTEELPTFTRVSGQEPQRLLEELSEYSENTNQLTLPFR